MKKIVVKMRSFKKLFGGDLLQLALLLSLLKVDPDNYLGYNPHSSLDPGGDIISGPAMLQDSWRHDDLSPRIHPKSMDTLLDLHQAEILEDLNSLGRYSRLSHYGGLPVHISAYILDTDHSGPSPPACQPNDGTESDSGISDTNHDSDQESNSEHDDTEKEKAGDEGDLEVDMECETILTQLADPTEVLGLEAIVGLTPPPEDEEMLAYTAGQDALEAELVHIDEQLMTIEDDLGHIDEQFIMMDQQLAETISDESMYETEVYNNAIAATEVDLDTIDIGGNNPFDDWQREALSDLNDLVLDNVQNEVLSSVPASRSIEPVAEGQENPPEDKKEEEILQDPDLFPTDQTQSGSALLEDFDEDLLESKFIRPDLDKIVKQDVVLPQMSSLQNSSHPYRSVASVAPASLLDHQSFSEQQDNLTQSAASSKESSVDRDLMEEINVDVDQDDEDIIMQVLRESNINFDEIPIDIDGLKVEEEIKLEDIKEEVVEVEDIGYQISIVDGAAAKAEIDYDQLHSDIKAKFQEADDGYSFAELTLGSQFSDSYNPGFNSRAFENDHSYGVATKLEPGLLEPTTSRRRNVSESSGYSSMTEELPGSSSRCRDEIKAKKLKLPFLVQDIINSPVDLFNEMLLRPGLSSEQLQLCKDIRRRGKNKVAAQNCRKRKMDTIEELQHQVDQVRRRREQLLRAREELEAERARWSSKLSYLEENVLHGIGKELGMFTLEVRDNTVVVTSTARLLTAGGAEKSPRRSPN